MPSVYPSAFDTFITNIVNATLQNNIHPFVSNDANSAINAIERELGINPSGIYADVATRLAQGGGGGSATADWINVRDPAYGAVGDGSTVDTSAIQDAIDACPNSGGTVFFPPGVYIINGSTSPLLTLTKPNVTIAGAGWGSIIKAQNNVNSAGATPLPFFAPQNSAPRPIFRDLCFDGNRGGGAKCRAISASASFAQYGTIFNCRFTALSSPGGGAGGFATNSDYWLVDGCQFDDINGGAILLNPSSEFARISNNYALGWAGMGKYDAFSNQGNDHQFIGNQIEFYSDTGINMAGDWRDAGQTVPGGGHMCIGNKIWECGNSGLNTGGGHNNIIIGNSCFSNGRLTTTPRSSAGIRVRDHTSRLMTSECNIIIGNRCYEDTVTYTRSITPDAPSTTIPPLAALSGDPDIEPTQALAPGQIYGIEVVNYGHVGDVTYNPKNNIIVGNSLSGNRRFNLHFKHDGGGNLVFGNEGAAGKPAIGERDANPALAWLLALLDGMGIVDDQTTVGTGGGGGVSVISGTPTGGADGDLNVDEGSNSLWYRSNGTHRQLVDATKLASLEELQASATYTHIIDTSNTNFPVMVAKFPMRVVAASLLHYGPPPLGPGDLAASDTNYWSVLLRRTRLVSGAFTAATIATRTTQATGAGGVVHRIDWNFDAVTFSTANQICQTGDGIDFAFVRTPATGGTTPSWGTAAGTRLVGTVRYEPV